MGDHKNMMLKKSRLQDGDEAKFDNASKVRGNFSKLPPNSTVVAIIEDCLLNLIVDFVP